MSNIAIFASGSGTNAQNIIEYFNVNKPGIHNVSLVLSNSKEAFVLQRAENLNVDTFVFNKEQFYGSELVLKTLQERGIDFIVLAGFLWLVPVYLTNWFHNRIVNIHPALLPKYGGKGMFGMKVHNAVVNNREKESGITIHYVNENYDEGSIIFQAKCAVDPGDTAEDVASKVHKLEYRHFPRVIEEVLR